MRVREATVEDHARIVEMAICFLGESYYGRLFPADPNRLAILLQLCVATGVIYVAEVEEGIVGMIALVALTDPIGGVDYADEIAWWVDPAHRAGMVGPRLLMQAQAWVRFRRLAFLKMVAPADRPDVGDFYRRIGFEAVETAYIKRF